MSTIDNGNKSGKGRPSVDSAATTVRMERAMIAALDDWRRHQSDLPGRPEAIRRLIDLGLEAARKGIAPSTPTEAGEVR